MCFAALLYVLYVADYVLCLSKTWDFLWGVALWQAHNFLELNSSGAVVSDTPRAARGPAGCRMAAPLS
jgi:hypothetical protein